MSVSKKGALLAAAAAFLVFLPSLSHGWLSYDDPMFLLNETGWRGLGWDQIRWAFSSRVGSVYQPLAWLSYGVDHAFWGMDPRGYHLQSVLWHALSSGLMFLLARRLLKDDASALFAALIFAVHPLRVESVSWASERRDVIVCAFTLAATWAYASRRSMSLVFVLFLLSLLGKGMALLLPAAFLALDYYPLRRVGPRGEGLLAALKEKLPLFALTLAFGVAGLAAQERIRWTWEQHGLAARLAQACYALAFYARKTVWPSGLMPLYELRPPLDPLEPRFLLSVAAVAAIAWLAWSRRRTSPWLAASAFWYAALLFPVSGLFQFGPQLVADRYSYITTLPLAVLAGGLFLAARARRPRLALAAAALVGAGLAAACVRQQSYWRDSETLWARVLSGDPRAAMANASVGILRVGQGRYDEARERFLLALAAFPGCVEDQDRLAALLERGGASPEEERRLRASVETHPLCRRVRANLGALAAQTGDYAGAVETLRVSVLLDPDDIGARRNLERARAALARDYR